MGGDMRIGMSHDDGDVLHVASMAASLRLRAISSPDRPTVYRIEDGVAATGMLPLGDILLALRIELDMRQDALRARFRSRVARGLAGPGPDTFSPFVQYAPAVPEGAVTELLAAYRALDMPDEELDGRLPRGVDGLWSREMQEALSSLGARRGETRTDRLLAITGRDWSCPGCGRGKPALLRRNGRGQPFLALARHHDHSGDGRPPPKRMARFPMTVVCGDCNVAEAAAKARLVREGVVPGWFSFAPSEIGLFIGVGEGRPHRMDHAAAERLARSDPEILQHVEANARGRWPTMDPENGVFVLDGEVHTAGEARFVVGEFDGMERLAGELGTEDGLMMGFALQARSTSPSPGEEVRERPQAVRPA